MVIFGRQTKTRFESHPERNQPYLDKKRTLQGLDRFVPSATFDFGRCGVSMGLNDWGAR